MCNNSYSLREGYKFIVIEPTGITSSFTPDALGHLNKKSRDYLRNNVMMSRASKRLFIAWEKLIVAFKK